MRLTALDDQLLDLLGERARGDVEQRNVLLHHHLGDAIADDLEQLILEPADEFLVGGPRPLTEEADHLHRILDLDREVAVDHRADGHARLRILDVADASAELHAADFAQHDEPDLGHEHVAAGERVDEHRQERDVLRLERVAPGVEPADELAVLVEQRALVLSDGDLRLHRDGPVGPLVDEEIFGLVRPRDEHLLRALLYEIEQTHRIPPVPCLRCG